MLAIFGAGGHSRVCIDIAVSRGYNDIVVIDVNNTATVNEKILTYPVLNISLLKDLSSFDEFFVAIGDCVERFKWIDKILALVNTDRLIKLTHPEAVVSSAATVGAGSLVAANAHVGPEVNLGLGVIVNTLASVEHQSTIGHSSHVAPGCKICGAASIGKRVFCGANSVVFPRVVVANECVIGANAVVATDIKVKGSRTIGFHGVRS
mgnify:CR=1 FL=1